MLLSASPLAFAAGPLDGSAAPQAAAVFTNHAPVITPISASSGVAGLVVTLSANIVDLDAGDRITNAVLSFRIHNSGTYSNLAMAAFGSVYSAVIPSNKVTTAGLDYYFSAWDAYGMRANSSTNTLSVLAAKAPLISLQPQNRMIQIQGAAAVLNVIATGNPPPSYQWRLMGSNIHGATASKIGRAHV